MDDEPGQWREARRKQRNRRVAAAVLTATLAASLFFFYEADKWRLQETSVIPAAVRVVEKPKAYQDAGRKETGKNLQKFIPISQGSSAGVGKKP